MNKYSTAEENDPDYWYFIGIEEKNKCDFKKAKYFFLKALNINKAYFKSNLQLSFIYVKLNNINESCLHLLMALRNGYRLDVNVKELSVNTEFRSILSQSEWEVIASSYLSKKLKHSDKEKELICTALGLIFTGKHEEASEMIMHYEYEIDKNGSNTFHKRNEIKNYWLSWLCIESHGGNGSGYNSYYSKVIDADSNFTQAYLQRAWLQLDLSRMHRQDRQINESNELLRMAINDIQKALELDPEFWYIYNLGAQIQDELEDYNSQIEYLKKEMKLNPQRTEHCINWIGYAKKKLAEVTINKIT